MKEIEIKGIDEVVYYTKLENGLKIYINVFDKVETTNMSLAVKYGSIHTEFSVEGKKYKVPGGLAHFLEHVKFNETEETTAHDFYYKTGAEVNAFTTFDYTSYYVLAMDNVEENLIHLLDFVQNRFFTKELIEKEKGIICEEEKMGEDSPETVNYFGIFKNIFEKSNYKNLVTGNLNEINKTTLKDIELVFDQFYHPENMALFITGKVNPYEIEMIVKKNQNSKKFRKYLSPKVLLPKEKEKVHKTYTCINGNVMQPRAKVGIKILRENFSKYSDFDIRFAINLVLNMNFGSTSDLKDHLVENHLANNIGASCDIYEDYVIIVAATETKYPEEVIEAIEEKFKNLEVDEETFNRKIKALIATYILNYDDVEKVNSLMQDDFINYGDIVSDVKEQYENFTIKKFRNIIKQIDLTNKTTFIMKPNEK